MPERRDGEALRPPVVGCVQRSYDSTAGPNEPERTASTQAGRRLHMLLLAQGLPPQSWVGRRGGQRVGSVGSMSPSAHSGGARDSVIPTCSRPASSRD